MFGFDKVIVDVFDFDIGFVVAAVAAMDDFVAEFDCDIVVDYICVVAVAAVVVVAVVVDVDVVASVVVAAAAAVANYHVWHGRHQNHPSYKTFPDLLQVLPLGSLN